MADEFGVGCFSPGIRPLVTLTLRTRVVILAQWQRAWLLVVSLESSFGLGPSPSPLHRSIYQVPPHKVHGSFSCISTANIFFSSFLVFCLSLRLHFCLTVCLSLFSFLLLLKFSDDFVHDERDYVDFYFYFSEVFILKIIPSFVSLCVLKAIPSQTPEGRAGISHVCPLFGISGLSLDSSFLSLFVFLVLFLSCHFFSSSW